MSLYPKNQLTSLIRILMLFRLASVTVLVSALMFGNVPLSAAQTGEADVIIALDSGGSMASEVAAFQSTITAGFVAPLVDAGINLRLVFVADEIICLPAPLGCTDGGDPDLFLHTGITVGSTDALSKIIGSAAIWGDFLRPSSNRTIIVLSDDNSELLAEDFNSQLLISDPGFAGYKFHGIVDTGTGCGAIGTEYIELSANITNGTLYDICGAFGTAGVGAALQAIANIIIADVNVPPPPPPPDSSCKDSAKAAIDAGRAYVKASRVVRRLCKSDGPDCAGALAEASDAFAVLSDAKSDMEAFCP